jgi:hypothetical protein
MTMASPSRAPPTTWTEGEIAAGRASYPQQQSYSLKYSSHNPTPGIFCNQKSPLSACCKPKFLAVASSPSCSSNAGTGRAGFLPVPPNNYPFYDVSREVYTPLMQADGGQLSEWQPLYAPSREQADADRAAAAAAGIPHGYVAPGDRFKGMQTIELRIVSELVSIA